MKGKLPLEGWILSKRNHPRRHGGCESVLRAVQSGTAGRDVVPELQRPGEHGGTAGVAAGALHGGIAV